MIERDRAVHFSEKPQTSSGLINGGFFVFDRRIFDSLTQAEDCDFTSLLYSSIPGDAKSQTRFPQAWPGCQYYEVRALQPTKQLVKHMKTTANMRRMPS